MTALWVLLGTAVFVMLAAVTAAYACFRMAFYAPRKNAVQTDAIDVPEGEIYEPYRPQMERWTREVRAMPREHFTITSFDGLTLHADFLNTLPARPWRSCSMATGAAPSGI